LDEDIFAYDLSDEGTTSDSETSPAPSRGFRDEIDDLVSQVDSWVKDWGPITLWPARMAHAALKDDLREILDQEHNAKLQAGRALLQRFRTMPHHLFTAHKETHALWSKFIGLVLTVQCGVTHLEARKSSTNVFH
jgi:hypothetical protein